MSSTTIQPRLRCTPFSPPMGTPSVYHAYGKMIRSTTNMRRLSRLATHLLCLPTNYCVAANLNAHHHCDTCVVPTLTAALSESILLLAFGVDTRGIHTNAKSPFLLILVAHKQTRRNSVHGRSGRLTTAIPEHSHI